MYDIFLHIAQHQQHKVANKNRRTCHGDRAIRGAHTHFICASERVSSFSRAFCLALSVFFSRHQFSPSSCISFEYNAFKPKRPGGFIVLICKICGTKNMAPYNPHTRFYILHLYLDTAGSRIYYATWAFFGAVIHVCV